MGEPVFDPERKRGSLQRRLRMTSGQIREVIQAKVDAGEPEFAVARALGCHHTTVREYLRGWRPKR